MMMLETKQTKSNLKQSFRLCMVWLKCTRSKLVREREGGREWKLTIIALFLVSLFFLDIILLFFLFHFSSEIHSKNFHLECLEHSLQISIYLSTCFISVPFFFHSAYFPFMFFFKFHQFENKGVNIQCLPVKEREKFFFQINWL